VAIETAKAENTMINIIAIKSALPDRFE